MIKWIKRWWNIIQANGSSKMVSRNDTVLEAAIKIADKINDPRVQITGPVNSIFIDCGYKQDYVITFSIMSNYTDLQAKIGWDK